VPGTALLVQSTPAAGVTSGPPPPPPPAPPPHHPCPLRTGRGAASAADRTCVAVRSWLRVELWDVDQVGQPQHSQLSGKPRANPLLSVAYGQQPSVRSKELSTRSQCARTNR